jgi:four helix bundle protein
MLDKHFALRDRTKRFALRVLKLCDSLPRTDAGRTISRQLPRSGTSVAANYRAVGRARSQSEFVAKLGVVLEETDESLFWLELLAEGGILPERRLGELTAEANQHVAIFVASQQTAKRKRKSNGGVVRDISSSPDHPIVGTPGHGSPDLPIARPPDRPI